MIECTYLPDNAFSEGSPWEFYEEEDALEAKGCAEKILKWVREVANSAKEKVRGEEKGN